MAIPSWLTPSDPQAPALWTGEQQWSYDRLMAEGELLSRVFDPEDVGPRNVVGILGNHQPHAYAAIIAAHRAGVGYLPMNPVNPPQRLADMLHQANTRLVVVPEEGIAALMQLLPLLDTPMTWVCPDVAGWGASLPFSSQHRFLDRADLERAPSAPPVRAPSEDALAYLMFTSGSTGRPKGVPVTFGNLTAYVDYWRHHHPIGPGDRVAQPADLTFDLCIHPIFVTWASGATLCPIPGVNRMAPAKFILDTRLTVWVSVPSVAVCLEKLRVLREGVFPSIRLSLFCGEPLPVRTAEAWSRAACNGRLINLYGPTEATVSISEYEWRGRESAAEARDGIVPIGWIFPTQRAALRDDDGLLQQDGPGTGELCLAGSQVTQGYLNHPEKSAHHYFTTPATGVTLWYRTGDRAQRREDGCLFFIGRVDNQIKLHGHRIELQEVDGAIRRACGHDLAVAVPWPRGEEGILGIAACVAGTDPALPERILTTCRALLPPYMWPSRVEMLPALPMNANGKIDRAALVNHLDSLQRTPEP
ncbi:MAG: AMP-binding protein [Magnetococcales bacterium]|nr:AMP-binding protein [Magnetococcales bacterium]